MKSSEFYLTREKHLDHMVRVVPFIVCAYAIQCYFIAKIDFAGLAVNGLFFLGGCLISMIMGFITYDLTHTVKFEDATFTVAIQWLHYSRTYAYQDIANMTISETGQSFAKLTLFTKNGKKLGFYFVDEPDKLKAWLEQKRAPELQAAA